MQPNNKLDKRQACYLRDLQQFLGTMILAYRKGAMNETDPLSRRPYFVSHATIHEGWRGSVRHIFTTEVPSVTRSQTQWLLARYG
jgi:hypothetical protein